MTHQAASLNKAQNKGWIRWSGLIALVVLIGGLVVAGYFFVGWGLKAQIESRASQAWGASVELERVDLSFNPLGIAIQRIAFTDPEQPMQNLVEIDQMQFDINLYHLVAGRFVVEQAVVHGVALHQPRLVSGALMPKRRVEKDASPAEPVGESLSLPSFDLPDATTVLARETLATSLHAQKIESDLQQFDQQWQKLQQSLPNEVSLKAYQQEFEALFKPPFKDLDDVKSRQARLVELQQAIKQDSQAVSAAQTHLRGVGELKAELDLLKRLPDQDLQRLLSTYSIDQQGLSNISLLLFGKTLQQQVDVALSWYQKAQPLLNWLEAYQAKQQAEAAAAQANQVRAVGERVVFEEFDPQPSFMIKKWQLSGRFDGGRFEANVTDINLDQQFSKKPTRFDISVWEDGRKPLTIHGVANRVDSADWQTVAQVGWTDYQVQDWWLLKEKDFAVKMQQALSGLKAEVALTNFDEIKAHFVVPYRQVVFDASSSEADTVQRYVAPALAQVTGFDVELGLTGKWLSPSMAIKSDLDRQLSGAFDRLYQQALKDFEQDLTRQIKASAAVLETPLQDQLQRLGLNQAELDAQQNKMQAWLQQNPQTAFNQVEVDIKNQAQQKLKQQQAKMEAEAKSQLEQQKRKLEDEAKSRLDNELKNKIKLPF